MGGGIRREDCTCVGHCRLVLDVDFGDLVCSGFTTSTHHSSYRIAWRCFQYGSEIMTIYSHLKVVKVMYYRREVSLYTFLVLMLFVHLHRGHVPLLAFFIQPSQKR